jgi:hypothetical protein
VPLLRSRGTALAVGSEGTLLLKRGGGFVRKASAAHQAADLPAAGLRFLRGPCRGTRARIGRDGKSPAAARPSLAPSSPAFFALPSRGPAAAMPPRSARRAQAAPPPTPERRPPAAAAEAFPRSSLSGSAPFVNEGAAALK